MEKKNYRMMSIDELLKEREELEKNRISLMKSKIDREMDAQIKRSLKNDYLPIHNKHMMVNWIFSLICMLSYAIGYFVSMPKVFSSIAIVLSVIGLYIGVIHNEINRRKYFKDNYQNKKEELFNEKNIYLVQFVDTDPEFMQMMEIINALIIVDNQINYLEKVTKEVKPVHNIYRDRYLDEEEECSNELSRRK